MVQSVDRHLVSAIVKELSLVSGRNKLLHYLFRFESLTDSKGRVVEMDPVLLDRLYEETSIDKTQIFRIYDKLLYDLRGFRWTLRSRYIKWAHTPSGRYRKVRIYLHKLCRIAPIFDYTRALHNLRILHTLLERKCYWPTLSTQLALIIFITDRNLVRFTKMNPISQHNIRYVCHSSAYGFHYARNLLQINRFGAITKNKG